MSLFQTVSVPCPACGKPNAFEAAHSVNADRRPDLRDAILDGSFQRQDCASCGESFRMDPEFNYIDVGAGQWIGCFPSAELGRWRAAEARARAAYDRTFGAAAPASARALAEKMDVRVVFGWAALREKLLARAEGLDDLSLELVKIAMLRGTDNGSLGDATELRLGGTDGLDLQMAWIVAANERPVELLRVPRQLYHDIDQDRAGWASLREELGQGLLVDYQRLMLESE